MRRHHYSLQFIAAFTLASNCALATIVVTGTPSVIPVNGTNGGKIINIPGAPTNAVRTYIITGDQGDYIEEINVGSSGTPNSGSITLHVLPCSSSCATPNQGVGNVDTITVTRDTNPLTSDIFIIDTININGNLGQTECDYIDTQILVGGTINGNITAKESIAQIRAVGGISASIEATNGTIGNIYAGDGNVSNDSADRDIGSSGTPVTIRANGSIDNIIARDVHANVQPLYDAGNDPDGTLTLFRASGNVSGNISVGTYTDRIFRVGWT